MGLEKSHRAGCVKPEQGDRLAVYELGLLSDRERAEFELHLGECEACLESLYGMAPYAAAMAAEPGAAAARPAESAPARPAQARTPVRVPVPGPGLAHGVRRLWGPRPWRVLVPAAASLAAAAAIIIVFGVPHRGHEQDSAFSSLARIEPVPYVSVVRRTVASEASRRFDEGMAFYTRRRYADAARVLSEAARPAQAASGVEPPAGEPATPGAGVRDLDAARLEDQARFFLGLSLLLAGNAAEAAVHLQRATGSPVAPLADRARWYLAQAKLVSGDPEGALGPLRELAAGSPVYAADAARQIEQVRAAIGSRRPAP